MTRWNLWMVVMIVVSTLAVGTAWGAEPGNGYRQIDRYTPLDYSVVPRNLVKAPMLVSTNARYALMTLGHDLKNVVILIWDESQGTGKGYDTLYVDVNLNGDLSEPAEKFFWANDSKGPKEKYVIPPIVLPGGDRFVINVETWGKPDTISWASGYEWQNAKGQRIMGLGHIPLVVVPDKGPYASEIQWGKNIQEAPVHVLGAELIAMPYPGEGSGIEPPKNPWRILPGMPVGRTRAGTAIGVSWQLASLGSSHPSTEMRVGASAGQVYLRVIKEGKAIREIPLTGGCSCTDGFGTTLTVPSDIPPGRHQIVFRYPLAPELGGPAEFLFPIEIANETYGQPVPSPVADAIAGQLEAKTRLVSLRRAGEPEQLTARSARERALGATVSDTWFDCFHREGFISNLDACRGTEPLFVLGPRAWAVDSNRGLLRFDLAGLPADAKVKAAWLQLSVQTHEAKADTRLAAYALRRAWDELPGTNGTYACQVGPRHKVKDGGEKWGKPGAQDTENDRFAAPAATAVEAQNVAAFDLTATVQQWHAGKLPNHGLLLQLEGDNKAAALDLISSESPDLVRRPTLMVAYKGGPAQPVFTMPAGEDIRAASAAAKSSGKTLLVIVVSPACRLSDSFLGSLGTPEVKAALGDRFVVQRLDMANWPGLTARYGVTSVPAVVAVKPDGAVKGRAQGRELMEVKQFLAFLAKSAE